MALHLQLVINWFAMHHVHSAVKLLLN